MRIALDTNVLVSAYTARGLSADVFRHILVDHELVLSEQVLLEFSRTLETKIGLPRKYVVEIVHELRQHYVEPQSTGALMFEVMKDPDNRIVLTSAVNAGAEILITGDRDLVDVRDRITDIRVQTPRQFWEQRARDPAGGRNKKGSRLNCCAGSLALSSTVGSGHSGGANTRTPEHQNTRTPEHPNTRTPEHPNTRTPEHPNDNPTRRTSARLPPPRRRLCANTVAVAKPEPAG